MKNLEYMRQFYLTYASKEMISQAPSGKSIQPLTPQITHQDLSQIQMYVNYFDRYVKTEDENPTIVILLCKQKSQALLEIILPKGANVHARECRLNLPSKKVLQTKVRERVAEVGA